MQILVPSPVSLYLLQYILIFALTVYSTREGRNDEANRNTIFTPGAILGTTKPSTLSMEQTPGLLLHKQHRLYFRNLANQCLESGYNIRWEVVDTAWYGMPQHRPRLIILGAKFVVLNPRKNVVIF